MPGRRRRPGLLVGGVLVVAILAGGLSAYTYLSRDVPERYDDVEAHFKYGSIGADTRTRAGIPYPLWLALPQVFPDYLPDRPGDGYARLGFVYEPGATRPIGTSLRENPVPLIGLNCAVCHTGTVRDEPNGSARIVLGMPAHQFDSGSYFRFLFNAAQDDRFNADVLLPAIQAANPSFSWFDSVLYRVVVIPETRQRLQAVAQEFTWLNDRPDFLPGRVDTFNPYKGRFGFDMKADTSVGTADLPSLWNQRVREGMWLHWDGNNNSVDERNRSAGIGAGATVDSLDDVSLKRVRDWILDFGPPGFPPDKLDVSRAEAGRTIFQAQCAACHAVNGPGVGQVVPIAEIGTDPERLNSFTPELAEKMNTLGTGKPWRFSHFRKTDGYASMPLDGLWLRAPYLHNGSVPTLRDLLKPPEERPKVFYRGYDVLDYANVGFVSSGPEAERWGVKHDTSVRGNGNGGHLYGVDLSPAEIERLLEFLKTL